MNPIPESCFFVVVGYKKFSTFSWNKNFPSYFGFLRGSKGNEEVNDLGQSLKTK